MPEAASNVPQGLALPLKAATMRDPSLDTLWQATHVAATGAAGTWVSWRKVCGVVAPGWRRTTVPLFTSQ